MNPLIMISIGITVLVIFTIIVTIFAKESRGKRK